jgi:hypothetical protein
MRPPGPELPILAPPDSKMKRHKIARAPSSFRPLASCSDRSNPCAIERDPTLRSSTLLTGLFFCVFHNDRPKLGDRKCPRCCNYMAPWRNKLGDQPGRLQPLCSRKRVSCITWCSPSKHRGKPGDRARWNHASDGQRFVLTLLPFNDSRAITSTHAARPRVTGKDSRGLEVASGSSAHELSEYPLISGASSVRASLIEHMYSYDQCIRS